MSPSAAPATGRQYYRSFASYEIPFRPVKPVSYAETEGLAGYYAAYRDPAGRVVRFDKIGLVRLSRETWIPSPLDPPGSSFFIAVSGPGEAEYHPGTPIAYTETEKLDEFFVAVVESPGTPSTLVRLRREITFTDTYTYWPNGEMRSRVKGPANKPSVTEYYDTEGNRLEERPAFSNGNDTSGKVDVAPTVN